jgi:signal transduction histidine kinase
VQVVVDKQRLAMEEAQEFQARQKQLEAAGRVAAQIAHQVKNPLAIINSAAYCLQRAAPPGQDSAAQQIRIIREEVERADQIITKLMGYAQLAEGRVEKLDLAEEVSRAIAQVFPPGANDEVQIERKLAPDLPPLLMQRVHLSETLVNILLNAREAIHGPGRIQIAATCAPEEAVEIRISDSGPGIAPNRFEQIFEPYFSTKPKGTGLGLAIAKQNTEMYGGTLRVESVLGKGATFVLHFPTRTFMAEKT